MSENARKDCRTQGKYKERNECNEDKRSQMSEDPRKDFRTQGKYRERNQNYEDKRSQKRQDKRSQGSSTLNEPQDKKFHKRKSDVGKTSNTSLCSESEFPVRYEENSVRTFSELEETTKPIEIKTSGQHILSNTENGDSVVFYERCFLEKDEAVDFMRILHNSTNWHEKNIIINGVEHPQPRLVAWYGPFPYTYSGATLEPAEMPDTVLKIKEKVEDYLKRNGINVILNSVLLNLYRDNKDSVAWHSDDELSMGVCPTIASVSLGETRKFEMKRKQKKTEDESSLIKSDEYFVQLTNGSLLIMDGCMQKDWLHRVPKEYHDKYRRINLTFRTVYSLDDLPSSPGTIPKILLSNSDSVLKKSSEIKTDYRVNYDEENFPPLNSDVEFPSLGAKSNGELNGSHDRSSLESNSEITESNGLVDTEQSPTKTQNSDKISFRETHDKITVSENAHHAEAFGNMKTKNKIDESEGCWDSDLPSNDNFFKNDEIIDRCESFCDEQSTILNNLNEDKKNLKMDMQNKNLHVYNSNFSNNNVSATANIRKGKNFSLRRHNNAPSNFVNNVRENVHNVKKEPTSGKTGRWTPNVKAKEFVPFNVEAKEFVPSNVEAKEFVPSNVEAKEFVPSNVEAKEFVPSNVEAREFVPSYNDATFSGDIPFESYDLESLANYKVHVMNGDTLRNYAFALKEKVLERFHQFNHDQEELEVLCALTDGDQTEKNQKIISSRMASIITRAFKHGLPPNFQKSYRYPRKQNYIPRRRYEGSSRERPYRQ